MACDRPTVPKVYAVYPNPSSQPFLRVHQHSELADSRLGGAATPRYSHRVGYRVVDQSRCDWARDCDVRKVSSYAHYLDSREQVYSYDSIEMYDTTLYTPQYLTVVSGRDTVSPRKGFPLRGPLFCCARTLTWEVHSDGTASANPAPDLAPCGRSDRRSCHRRAAPGDRSAGALDAGGADGPGHRHPDPGQPARHLRRRERGLGLAGDLRRCAPGVGQGIS